MYKPAPAITLATPAPASKLSPVSGLEGITVFPSLLSSLLSLLLSVLSVSLLLSLFSVRDINDALFSCAYYSATEPL